MNEKRTSVSDYKLERYLLGELPQEEMETVRRRLEEDGEVRERLKRLERSNRELQEKYPAEWMGRQIRMRAEGAAMATSARAFSWRLWAMPVVVATLLVAVLPMLFEQPETRIKGLEPHLKLFLKTSEGSETLADSSEVREGDLIQIVYLAAEQSYGTIFSVDGRGEVTQHLPGRGKLAGRLKTVGADTLDFSYELDDAPRWERFYFVTADSVFDLGPVEREIARLAMEEGGTLRLPGEFKQHLFTLFKGAGNE
jgi:hypothetical protein